MIWVIGGVLVITVLVAVVDAHDEAARFETYRREMEAQALRALLTAPEDQR